MKLGAEHKLHTVAYTKITNVRRDGCSNHAPWMGGPQTILCKGSFELFQRDLEAFLAVNYTLRRPLVWSLSSELNFASLRSGFTPVWSPQLFLWRLAVRFLMTFEITLAVVRAFTFYLFNWSIFSSNVWEVLRLDSRLCSKINRF